MVKRYPDNCDIIAIATTNEGGSIIETEEVIYSGAARIEPTSESLKAEDDNSFIQLKNKVYVPLFSYNTGSKFKEVDINGTVESIERFFKYQTHIEIWTA